MSISKFKISTMQQGVKERFVIKKRFLLFWWVILMDKLASPAMPKTYKFKKDAEKELKKLQTA